MAGQIPAGVKYHEMMSHIDCWATLATMVGLTPPPHDWVDDDGKGIYFDSIDNSAYILGKAEHSARNSWVYIDGENFMGARAADNQRRWRLNAVGLIRSPENARAASPGAAREFTEETNQRSAAKKESLRRETPHTENKPPWTMS